MVKNNIDKFITKCKLIHGDKYEYHDVEYDGICNKIKIICKIHGLFEQSADSHSRGNGCPKCSGNYKSNTNNYEKVNSLCVALLCNNPCSSSLNILY